MSSIFDDVVDGPPIEVFALNKAYLEDLNPDKVNLGVGGKNNNDFFAGTQKRIKRTPDVSAISMQKSKKQKTKHSVNFVLVFYFI